MERWEEAHAAFESALKLRPEEKSIKKAFEICESKLKSHSPQSNTVNDQTVSTLKEQSKAQSTSHTNPKKNGQVLGGLYSDKKVHKKYVWGPIPKNGEFNDGYVESGPFLHYTLHNTTCKICV